MDLSLTESQKKIIRSAQEFARKEFPPLACECDREEKFPWEVWRKAGESGFLGTFIPIEYGGLGLGYFEHALVMEEFWRVDPGMGNILLTVFGAEILKAYGTEDQKKRTLPLLAQGKAIAGCAITEPNAGSDIFAQGTQARKTPEGYLINGSKQFISNGSIADFVLVMAMTRPEAKKPTDRFSFFLVEKDRPGFAASKLKGKLGIRASDTAELFFDGVLVSEKNLVGGREGEGFRQVMHLFNINRIVAAAQGIGVAQGAFDKTVAYVKEHQEAGKPLAGFQGVQFKIAEMAARIEAARRLCYTAAWMVDQGQMDPKLISMAKLVAGEAAVWVAGEALELHGRSGCLGEHDVGRFYRDAKIVEIYEGAKEIEKITIAREILGR